MASTKKKPTLGYRMIELLDKKFDELDKDGSGSLSLDELFALSDTGKEDAQVSASLETQLNFEHAMMSSETGSLKK